MLKNKLLICFAFLCFISIATSAIAEEQIAVFGGINFGDSRKVVEKKITQMYGLKKFHIYEQYQIGDNRYRMLFRYDRKSGGLWQVKIYSSFTNLKAYRTKITAYWKDLDVFAAQWYGEGTGVMPHLLDVKERTENYSKNWKKSDLQADLGVSNSDYGYSVILLITDLRRINTRN